jgi:hypothetical protein
MTYGNPDANARSRGYVAERLLLGVIFRGGMAGPMAQQQCDR